MVPRYVFVSVLRLAFYCFAEAGLVAYNSKTHICCVNGVDGGLVAPLPFNISGRPASCCFSNDNLTAFIYDTTTYDCCGGRPQLKPDPDQLYICCQSSLYEFDNFICCAGQLIDRSSSRDCCGQSTYDRDTHICCQNDPADDTGSCRTTAVRIYERQNGHQECCGSKTLYNSQIQLCCELGNGSHAVYERTEEMGDRWMAAGCCAGQIMNGDGSEICRDGRVWKRPSTSYRYCADRLYDMARQRCCDGLVFDSDSGFDCCPGARVGNPRSTFGYARSKIYDPKTQICCGTDIIELTAKDIKEKRFSCCRVDSDPD